MIILLLAIQIYSHTAQHIEAHELCRNTPMIDYQIDNQIVCLPTDLIFKNGFDGVQL